MVDDDTKRWSGASNDIIVRDAGTRTRKIMDSALLVIALEKKWKGDALYATPNPFLPYVSGRDDDNQLIGLIHVIDVLLFLPRANMTSTSGVLTPRKVARLGGKVGWNSAAYS